MFSERIFEDILVKYPELIEDKLRFIGRQVNHFGKRIDILFEDRFNEKLIIELKKDNLDRNALSQVMEYEGYILSEKDPSARVMLIANRIPLNLKKAMDHHGIEYKEITNKHLLEFLEKRDQQILNLITLPQSDETYHPKQTSSNSTKDRRLDEILQKDGSIIGTVTNAKAYKQANDRFEIWFSRSSRDSFPYGLTSNSEGIKISIKIKDKIYTIGFHNTKTCIWLSARLDRDGYNLTDLLKTHGIENREKLFLMPLGNDTYQINRLNDPLNNSKHSRRGAIIELIRQGKSDQEILEIIDLEFPTGVFSTSNKQALYGTKRDLGQ
jgi:hypothetical protein